MLSLLGQLRLTWAACAAHRRGRRPPT